MKISLIVFTFFALLAHTGAYAQKPAIYGLQCSGPATDELTKCLTDESGKIDEANLPNEIILSTDISGKESLLKLVNEFSKNTSESYAAKLTELIPLIESSIATALIIQYEDEPQLYYYVVDKNGRLEVIFDGLNSVDLSSGFPTIYPNEPELFFLKSPVVSDTFKEWLEFLKEDEKT